MIKQIEEYPDYGISDSGEVVSLKGRGVRVLKPDMSSGHPRVTLDGKRYYVADIVAHYFIGPRPDPIYKIFYIDGDTSNCDVSNLKWMSPSDIAKYSTYLVSRRIELLGQF